MAAIAAFTASARMPLCCRGRGLFWCAALKPMIAAETDADCKRRLQQRLAELE